MFVLDTVHKLPLSALRGWLEGQRHTGKLAPEHNARAVAAAERAPGDGALHVALAVRKGRLGAPGGALVAHRVSHGERCSDRESARMSKQYNDRKEAMQGRLGAPWGALVVQRVCHSDRVRDSYSTVTMHLQTG